MSSLNISLIAFACVAGGALLGLFLRPALPQHHLRPESKDIVGQGMGLVGTMAALVLGLLIASAKSSIDAQNNDLTQMSANIVFLDRVLAHYGPESKDARALLHGVVRRICNERWSRDGSGHPELDPPSTGAEPIYDRIQQLPAKDEPHRALRDQALTIATGLSQTRWLMYEQSAAPVPMPLIIVLVSWLTILFFSFGLFAPRNATVVISLCIAALSVSGAILLILEMYTPLEGLIQVSKAPLTAALANLGK